MRPFFTVGKGGAERYAVDLVKALASRGHRLHVFAHEWDRPAEDSIIYHPVGMVRKPSWLRVLTFHWDVRRHLIAEDYDVVVGMTPYAPQMIFWLGDGLYKVWTRVAWPKKWGRWLMYIRRPVMLANLWLERQALQGGAECFLANSNLVKRQAMTLYKVPEERIGVVYPGVDLHRFCPELKETWRPSVRRELGFAEDDVVLLFVSNNFKRKGLDWLLQAVKNVSSDSSKIRLLVVGAGRTWLYKIVANYLGIGNSVRFVGSTRTVERYYAAADLFVLPTRYDPLAAVCLEAMACGLPVITTAMNGAAELIDHDRSGIVLSQRKPVQELAHQVQRLLGRGERARMGSLAVQRARALSFERHVGEVESLLCRAAMDRRSRHSLQITRPTADVVINGTFLPLLQQRQLVSYASLMESDQATEISYNRTKRIFCFKVADRDRFLTLYCKRHRGRMAPADWARRLFGKRIVSEGVKEWMNFLALHARGVPVATPVAAGDRVIAGGTKESFVVTLGLDDYVPLDDYVCNHFQIPLDKGRLREKHLLIKKVADLTRLMHWAGFNHRDYYLCHIFIRRKDKGEIDLRLIDLQRTGYRMPWRSRWLVKDLAALHYSSLATSLTGWDRLRFFALYFAGEADRRARRAQLVRVLRKSRAIARHDARLSAARSKS